MKAFLFLTLIFTSFYNASADSQNTVDTFMSEHTANGYSLFCQQDILVPKCRTLITYINNDSGESSLAFQISFSNQAQPFSAVELFIPSEEIDRNGSGIYYNYFDNTTSGSFKVSKEDLHTVVRNNDTLIIKDLPFGDLEFGQEAAIVRLPDGKEISYKKMY